MKRTRESFGKSTSHGRSLARVMVAISGVAIMGLAGCGQGESGGAVEDLQVVKAALDDSGGGGAYSNQCYMSGVPLPPAWGQSSLGTADGKWTFRGTFNDSYVTAQEVTEYTMNSSSPPGVCALNIRTGGTFDVICQGTNGKACFWEAGEDYWPAHGISPVPPTVPQGFTIQIAGDTGIPAAADTGVACTNCHAGENAFITHVNPSNHPTNRRELSTWKPSSFYDPIVPSTWVQNPGPSSSLVATQCQGCHVQSNAGRFPVLRNAEFKDGFCLILKKVVTQPASKGGMPPSLPGLPVADCTPGMNCPYDSDVQVRNMVAACGPPPLPTTSLVTGLGLPYGVGTSSLATQAHFSRSRKGEHQHYFFGGTTMPNSGCCTPHQNQHAMLSREDQINQFIYLPPGDAPREIMLQFWDGTQWWRAFWGEDLIDWSPRTRIGGLPATGSWQPLSFQLLAIGVPGNIKFQGMAYTLYDGSAYWADTLFRQFASPYNRTYVSQMWVKDSLPAGATGVADGGDSWSFVIPVP